VPTPLTTAHLKLRRFTDEDLDAIEPILSHPEVMRFSLSGPLDRAKCAKFLTWCQESYRQHGAGLRAVEYRATAQMIGYCGLAFPHLDGTDEVEIGYRLHPDYWRRGLATEAAAAIRDYAQQVRRHRRLISIIQAENTASIRVAEKIGMHYEKDILYKDQVTVRIYSLEAEL